MSVVITSGSKQYVVEPGQKIAVDHLKSNKVGDVFDMPVLFAFGNQAGKATVSVKVLSHDKDEKIRVVKYKAKSNYHRQYGFRALKTVLEILDDTAKKPSSKETKSVQTESKATKSTVKSKTTNPTK
jgi:ribosomal protein L21